MLFEFLFIVIRGFGEPKKRYGRRWHDVHGYRIAFNITFRFHLRVSLARIIANELCPKIRSCRILKLSEIVGNISKEVI